MADGRSQSPNSDDILALAADFPAATDEAWLKLIEKVLVGAPFDKKLVSRTYDGISIKPLYTKADWTAEAGFPGGPGLAGQRPGAQRGFGLVRLVRRLSTAGA